MSSAQYEDANKSPYVCVHTQSPMTDMKSRWIYIYLSPISKLPNSMRLTSFK